MKLKNSSFKFQVSSFKMQNAGRILLFLFFCSLFTVHCSLSYAESLSDIKLNALQAPVKERWGRDPFVRYEEKVLKRGVLVEERPIDLKVNGIIADGKKALAIINGGFYRKGDRVNDFLIVSIERDKILLEKNGKRFYLDIRKFAVESAMRGGKK